MGKSKRPAVLIVGINSFLGGAICQLLQKDFEVTGVYHRNKKNIPKGVELVQYEELSNIQNKVFAQVFIVAAYIPSNKENVDEKLIEANLMLPLRICQIFSEARIIFCSSVSVYENLSTTNKIEADSIPMPNSKYALSKLWGEKIIEQQKSNAILRISSMYGSGMNFNSFVPKIIKGAIQNGKITLWGQGQRMQNYIHVNDVAKMAVKAAMVSENLKLLAVNPNSYSNKEIAEIVTKNIPSEIEFQGEDLSPSFLYDNSKTIKKLGEINCTNIETGIKELIKWMKK